MQGMIALGLVFNFLLIALLIALKDIPLTIKNMLWAILYLLIFHFLMTILITLNPSLINPK